MLSLKRAKTHEKEGTKEFKVPHTLVIISFILAIVAVATWVLPAGAYDRIVNDAGRTVVVDGSFSYVEQTPQGIFSLLQAPLEGMMGASEIIAFLFVVSGSIAIITKTRAIDAGMTNAVKSFKGKEMLMIPVITGLFSIGGAVFGMTEEAIPFITMLIPLCLALGYDSIMAMAISYMGCIVGFATAMINPFSVGVAQNIANVQAGSGVGYRTLVWAVTTIAATLFLMWYGRRIKRNPELSPVYEIDQARREQLKESENEHLEFTTRHKLILSLILLCLAGIVVGVLKFDFGISEIAALFLATGIVSGLIGRLSLDDMANSFVSGAKDMIGAAVVVGFARGIVILAENGQIIDTILYQLSNFIGQLPSLVAGYVMFFVQMFINFFISSGSGQAALTMPIMAPLGELVGITPQTSILIFQFGDGFSNAIFPTSAVLMACLGVSGIPWSKWVKWILPLQLIFGVLAIIFITVAILMGWS
ncbi:YfcC family protein [Turicibacter sp. TJ11]|uniref:YfcC family protein n=1 Tax=Turicibacter sp. TJ11 TaxID=2806443 RepID=UPI001F2C2ACD|nr:YfcC family protein [Turicibacter sp. TJ11]